MEVDVQSILFQHPCNIFITGPSGCGKTEFVEGISMDENEIVSDVSVQHLIVFDDMLGEKDEEKIKLWFTRKGHHRNASVIYITQNMFQQSKSSRTISLNSRYMILFRNERDKNQIKILAQQMQAPHLLLAYEDATWITVI